MSRFFLYFLIAWVLNQQPKTWSKFRYFSLTYLPDSEENQALFACNPTQICTDLDMACDLHLHIFNVNLQRNITLIQAVGTFGESENMDDFGDKSS